MNRNYLFLLLTFVLLLPGRAMAQLNAYAGPDDILCDADTAYALMGNAWGGTPPYTYKWKLNAPVDGLWASDILDDTTIANPTIMVKPDQRISLYLEVTDSQALTAMDVVYLDFSKFIYLTVTPTVTIQQGDSVQLYPAVSGGVGTLRYWWIPGTGLRDSNIANPWARPMVTTTYNVLLMDSGSCVAHSTFKVIVQPVGMNQQQLLPLVQLSPNPALDELIIRVEGLVAPMQLELTDACGRQVRTLQLSAATTIMPREGLAPGIYHYRVLNEAGAVAYGKLLFQ